MERAKQPIREDEHTYKFLYNTNARGLSELTVWIEHRDEVEPARVAIFQEVDPVSPYYLWRVYVSFTDARTADIFEAELASTMHQGHAE